MRSIAPSSLITRRRCRIYPAAFFARHSAASRLRFSAGTKPVLLSVPWPIGDLIPFASARCARWLSPFVSSNSCRDASSIVCFSAMYFSMADRSYVSPSPTHMTGSVKSSSVIGQQRSFGGCGLLVSDDEGAAAAAEAAARGGGGGGGGVGASAGDGGRVGRP